MKRLFLAICVGLLLLLGWNAVQAKAADFKPTTTQQSGFTTAQEADILAIASGAGALRYCAAKFQHPAFEVTAKTLFFNVLGQLLDPAQGNASGRRDQLGSGAIAMFQRSYATGNYIAFVWNDASGQWRPAIIAMSDKDACQALDDMLRDKVTKPGNSFGYGPTFEPYAEQEATGV